MFHGSSPEVVRTTPVVLRPHLLGNNSRDKAESLDLLNHWIKFMRGGVGNSLCTEIQKKDQPLLS